MVCTGQPRRGRPHETTASAEIERNAHMSTRLMMGVLTAHTCSVENGLADRTASILRTQSRAPKKRRSRDDVGRRSSRGHACPHSPLTLKQRQPPAYTSRLSSAARPATVSRRPWLMARPHRCARMHHLHAVDCSSIANSRSKGSRSNAVRLATDCFVRSRRATFTLQIYLISW